MDTSRILSIVLTELTTENLRLQEKLESTINSTNLEVDIKVSRIKAYLRDFATNELSIAKFQAMTQQNNVQKNKE